MKLFRSIENGFLFTNSDDDDSWCFTLIEDSKPWVGVLSDKDIVRSASEVGQSIDEYKETMEEIFSAETDKFSLEINAKSGILKVMSWKKVTNSHIKFSLGTVTLLKGEDNVLQNVFSGITALIADLNENLKTYKQNLEDVKSCSERRLDQIEEMTSLKSQMEGELFEKFALILNEKKDKIRALKEEISELKNSSLNSEQTDPETDSSNDEAVIVKPVLPKLPSLQDSEIDTDFISKIPKQRTKKRPSKSPASNSKALRRETFPSDNETFEADELLDDL